MIITQEIIELKHRVEQLELELKQLREYVQTGETPQPAEAY